MKCVILCLPALLLLLPSFGTACPFCTVESQTLSEEIEASDVAVIAYLVKPAIVDKEGPDALGEYGVVDPDTGRALFRVARVEKGEELLEGIDTFEAVYFGDSDFEKPFFIRAIANEDKSLEWNIPLPLTKLGMQYIDDLKELPAEGPERLAYFLNYLQHEDPLLSQDAYDEFARSPYEAVIALEDKMDKDKLWNWIDSRDVSPSRRSLYFTMLGVCGDQSDADRLEQMMLSDSRVLKSAAEAASAMSVALGGPIGIPVVPEMVAMEERRRQLGFSALVGCYLKLRGIEGMDVVDEYFLANPDADYTQVFATCLALRVLGEETDIVPMPRLRSSMRLVLDKPEFAEQAITDLARWEDWTVLDRLVEMYETAPPRTFVKEPIIAYLDRASQQDGETGEEAKTALAKLEEQDPETVKRARSLLAYGFLSRARGGAGDGTPIGGFASTDAPAEEEPPALAEEESDSATGIPQPTAPVESPSKVAVSDSSLPGDEPTPDGDASSSAQGMEEPTVNVATSPAAETPEATSVAQNEQTADRVNPNPVLMVALPLLAVVGFMGLVWVILRGGV